MLEESDVEVYNNIIAAERQWFKSTKGLANPDHKAFNDKFMKIVRNSNNRILDYIKKKIKFQNPIFDDLYRLKIQIIPKLLKSIATEVKENAENASLLQALKDALEPISTAADDILSDDFSV
jgi:hypothetical protein